MKLFILFLFFSINALAANRQDLKSNLVGIGLNDTSDKVLEFNAASGTARAKLRSNISTSKLQFTNDGITYKDLGSGSGGGGYNLLSANSDFESNVTTGWVVSGATAVRTLYPVQGSDNKSYALVTTTEANGYYESVSQTVTSFLANGDLQNQALIMPVSGTWSIQTLSGTTVIASQTFTVSSDFQKSPIIFTPAGASQTIIKQRFTALVSSSVLAIDNTYLGETVNLKNGAVVGPWQSYTPTFAGLGTVTNIDFKWRRNGSNVEVTGTATTGTVTASQLQIGLPTGYITSTADLSTGNTVIGSVTRGNAGANANYILANRNLSYVLGGVQAAASGSYNIINGNGILSSSENFSLNFSVPIVGLSGSNTTFDSRCPNDISCANVFSASISDAGVVTLENLDFINTCTVSPAGVFTCSFVSGVFSVAPNCVVTNASNVNGTATVIDAISASQFIVKTFVSSTGALTSYPTKVICQKQGADYVAKRTIEGFMSKTVSHGSASLIRIESATINSGCTTLADQKNSTWINTVNSIGTGVCNLNFAAGTWTAAPTCFIMAGGTGAATGEIATSYSVQSTSQFQFYMSQPGVGAQNRTVNVMCIGIR